MDKVMDIFRWDDIVLVAENYDVPVTAIVMQESEAWIAASMIAIDRGEISLFTDSYASMSIVNERWY